MNPTQPQTQPALFGHSVLPSATKARATAEGGGKKCPYDCRKDFGVTDSLIGSFVVRRPGFQIGGKFIPSADAHPAANSVAKLGWTFCDEQAALHKLKQMT
jgi:hypothetical protein